LALLLLETAVAFFAVLLVFTGLLAWVDYRNEECDILDIIFGVGEAGNTPALLCE
jgi:hypothetical protein